MSESVNNNIERVENPILEIKDLSVFYGDKKAIKSVSVGIEENKISAIMGPSGCGKSTLLRAINRMHQLYSNTKIEGEIFLSDRNCTTLDPILLRRKIGMVFQRPNPFPTMSIYDNVIAGFKLNGIKLPKGEKDAVVERCLLDVGLWDEVKDNLKDRGSFLSGGQQQRLCIARAIASEPEVLLMDEPTSALDPIATKRIEELITKLKEKVTIVLVTHNMSQAARVSDRSLFMYLGELVEYGPTQEMFTVPKDKRTEEYLTGKFG